jgi:hypothetical protein
MPAAGDNEAVGCAAGVKAKGGNGTGGREAGCKPLIGAESTVALGKAPRFDAWLWVSRAAADDGVLFGAVKAKVVGSVCVNAM